MRVKIATDAARAAGTALAVRRHVIESFKVPSGSMSPTVIPGDHLFVLKDKRGERAGRGDVVVFRSPANPSQRFIKRIIATGGDRVQIDAQGRGISAPCPSRPSKGSPLGSTSPSTRTAWAAGSAPGSRCGRGLPSRRLADATRS
ncbi:signal peptidase I [Sorangium sp. KYC3313]|uniref:signal peptidase I n=1 Tax=Sorangium sp. KYC3313 TaxID=3449740 RepID=UPI003F887103